MTFDRAAMISTLTEGGWIVQEAPPDEEFLSSNRSYRVRKPEWPEGPEGLLMVLTYYAPSLNCFLRTHDEIYAGTRSSYRAHRFGVSEAQVPKESLDLIESLLKDHDVQTHLNYNVYGGRVCLKWHPPHHSKDVLIPLVHELSAVFERYGVSVETPIRLRNPK